MVSLNQSDRPKCGKEQYERAEISGAADRGHGGGYADGL